MAGHSKWAQIKRSKAVIDAKRGALFTRLAREITVSARAGSDPAGNFQLRTAINKAKSAGVPLINIERAISKGSGIEKESTSKIEAILYEGYGPGGVAILVEALTDNRNRTAADLRLAFSKHGGNLGENGCVAYLFEHRSEIRLEAPYPNGVKELSEEILVESIVDLDGNGYEFIDNGAIVFGPYTALETLQEGLTNLGWNITNYAHTWSPLTKIKLKEEATNSRCIQLLELLENLDDIHHVSSNLEAIGY